MIKVALNDVGQAFVDNAFLFCHLSTTLVAGETYALTGPSGSGKSSLLSIIANREKPTVGEVEWTGIETQAWVFQNPHGVSRRTALDHVVQPFLARGFGRNSAEELARAELQRFGLHAAGDRLFQELSGGEAQRLMLARGMATAPDLFLVDEPTAQLDLRTANAVNTSLINLAGRNTIVVIATHDPATRDSCSKEIRLGDYT
ncbi:ATP-binding cassette domain-containing protein [Rathayibacter tritici]|uniref:ATP-binding cassette domain-containing protein n=1 Tax=Rathayibacter tritici TaxID=33888 RepID=UPI000CE80FED|nr:ATP-binding cassette domain-containing protein [Rathayibacter tritici]PPI41616.1 ABC transporter [Rathayibacter tritici]